jgi:Uma2 family endonuclease
MSVLHRPAYQWTVEEYEELGRAGFFQGEQRVELLNGEIIPMSPIGIRHAAAVRLLNSFFATGAKARFQVDVQSPFILDPRSQPEPDLALLDPAVTKQRRHPTPEDLFLVIEVSDSTLRYDRDDKGPAYALRGVAEFWLLNLEKSHLEVYRVPGPNGYGDVQILDADGSIAPLAFPDLTIRVGDFLP